MAFTLLAKAASPSAALFDISPVAAPTPGTNLISDLQWNNLIDILDGIAVDKIAAASIAGGLVSDTEFDFLNGLAQNVETSLNAKELSANKGAVSGYAALDASQLLLLTNFPAGTGDQFLKRNAGNTALEFAAVPAPSIDSLTDTTITAAAAHEVLVRNAGNTAWVNEFIDNDNLAAGAYVAITSVGAAFLVKATNSFGLLELEGDHTSPSSQTIATFQFKDNDDIAQRRTYAEIFATIEDPLNTSLDGSLVFQVVENNIDSQYMRFNDAGTPGEIEVLKPLIIRHDAINDVEVKIDKNSATPGTGTISSLQMWDNDSLGNPIRFARINTASTSITSGSWAANMVFSMYGPLGFSAFMSINNGNDGTVTIFSPLTMLDDPIIFSGNTTTPATSLMAIYRIGAALNLNADAGDAVKIRAGGAEMANFGNGAIPSLQMVAASIQLEIGTPAASTGFMSLIRDGNYYHITGTTAITNITTAGWQSGSVIHLNFDGILTVTDAATGSGEMILADSSNYVTAAGDVLTLVLDGTQWIEVSRSTQSAPPDPTQIFELNSSVAVVDAGTGAVTTTLDGTAVIVSDLIGTEMAHRFATAEGTATLVSSNRLIWPADGNYILSGGTNGTLDLIRTTDWQSGAQIQLRFNAFATNDLIHQATISGADHPLFLQNRENHVDVTTDDVFSFMWDSGVSEWKEIWNTLPKVYAPASATDNAIARWDVTRSRIQNSGVIIDDSDNLSGLGTLNTHTIPAGTSTFAIISDNLSVFAATTSLQLLGVISDETGSGLLVFATNPTLTGFTMADATNIVLNATTGTQIGTATTQKMGFFGATPVVQQTALTAAATTITNAGVGVDVAIQALTSTTPFGFVNAAEGETLVETVLNLQVRVNELETKLQALGFLA